MNFSNPVVAEALEGELWKWCSGYTGKYSVSNYGRVASHITKKGTILKSSLTNSGYKSVKLSNEGIKKHFTVHRLVAQAFMPSEKLLTVNHIDGNKMNNCMSNLEWATQSENILHSFRLGLSHVVGKKGEDNNSSILTEIQVINILHCKGAIVSRKLAKLYGVSKTAVLDIWSRKTWAHL